MKPSGRLSRLRSLRRIHRWLGLTSVLFVLVLAATGIALNHTGELRLDSRYLSADWLLDLYGVVAPEPATSFDTGGARVTLMGSRLYVGDREAARNIDRVAGAADFGDLVAVATPAALLFIDRNAEVVDRVETTGRLPGPVDAVGRLDGRLVVSSGSAFYELDWERADFLPLDGGTQRVSFVAASPVPEPLQGRIERRYRGDGVSVERLIYDIHSGRILTRSGVFIMDLVALVLIGLALTGFYVWLRR